MRISVMRREELWLAVLYVENRVAGNIPHVVDFAYAEALVLGTNCLKSSEMEARI